MVSTNFNKFFERNRILIQKSLVYRAKIEDRPRPEIVVVPVVVVQHAIVAIEIPRVVSVVLGNTASLFAIVNSTTRQCFMLTVWRPFDRYDTIKGD